MEFHDMFDNGKTQPGSLLAPLAFTAIEFIENVPQVGFGNPHPLIADFDPARFGAAVSAQNDFPPLGRILDRIDQQIANGAADLSRVTSQTAIRLVAPFEAQ